MKINKIVYLVMLSLVVSVMFIGCGKTEQNTKYNVSVVWGRHSNTYKLNIQDVEEYIKAANESYGFVSLIELDGKPFMLDSYDIPEFKSGLMGLSEKNIEKKLNVYYQKIYQTLKECEPKEEEVDVMAAIKLAKTSLDAVEEGEKIIVINDSGVSTKGVVNFTDSILDNIDAEEVVRNLKETDSFIDLSGYKIVWYGLGNVAAPQEELSSHNVNVLKKIWESIFKAFGAEVEFVMTVPGNEIEKDLPNVSTIDILAPVNSISEKGFEKDKVIEFKEEDLKFKPESSELLISYDKAVAQLTNIISYLKEKTEAQILICGTTASVGRQNEAVALSKDRCEMIKKIIVKNGVREKQISTIGLGFEKHPFHINDIDKKGKLVEDKAKKNRSVFILHKDSNLAKKILEQN